MRFVCAMLAAIALAGCSPATDVPLAKQEVARFRQQWASGHCADIHASASRLFTQTTPRAQWAALCELITNRLGAFKSADEPGWSDNLANGSHLVSLTYQSRFANGPGQEQFTFVLEGGKALLVGYHVNSPLLFRPSTETLERGEKLGVAINNGVGS